MRLQWVDGDEVVKNWKKSTWWKKHGYDTGPDTTYELCFGPNCFCVMKDAISYFKALLKLGPR